MIQIKITLLEVSNCTQSLMRDNYSKVQIILPHAKVFLSFVSDGNIHRNITAFSCHRYMLPNSNSMVSRVYWPLWPQRRRSQAKAYDGMEKVKHFIGLLLFIIQRFVGIRKICKYFSLTYLCFKYNLVLKYKKLIIKKSIATLYSLFR